MMLRKYWKIEVILLAAVLVLGISYYYGVMRQKTDINPASYAVILYQQTDNEWATLMEGIDQAQEDFNVKIHYVTMGENETVQDQIQQVQREIEDGADGIILAAADSEEAGKGLEQLNIQIPIITVETGAGTKFADITADNYEMGQELGKKILADMQAEQSVSTEQEQKKVTIVKECMERDSVALRAQGLEDALRNSGKNIEIQFISRQKGDFSLRLFIGTVIEESGGYIAALDKYCTAEASAAFVSNKNGKNQQSHLKIYGIGSTAQTVSDLDNGNLQALVYQNEFNMGYEGVQALVEKERKGYMSDQFDIKYKLVTRDTLYESDNESLLFPSV